MVNDSVREELAASITPISTPMKRKIPEVPEVPRQAVSEAKPVVRRSHTADLAVKKTSQTLAEFKNPNASMPEWRIQLQNSVRQRTGRVAAEPIATNAVSPAARTGRNAAALKVQQDQEAENAVDLKVANALKRIEQSRRRYLPTEKAREGIRVAKAAASKAYPFNVVSRSADLPERPASSAPEAAPAVRPRLVSTLKIEKKRYDTNKLVPIPEAEYMAEPAETGEPKPSLRKNWSQKIEISAPDDIGKAAAPAEIVETDEPVVEPETDEIDDLAPLSMRFNSGLFDLMIGGFASFILFSPFIGIFDNWASLNGLLLYSAIFLAVMFIYLTGSIALLGRTFGMKLFSLDIVDIEQSEFPTLHQAAVSSSVYLISLVLGGLGFLPLFFNEERRAAHDLVSGTILVRGA